MKREDGKHVGWIYEYECTDENLKDWYGFNYVGQTRNQMGFKVRDNNHKNANITHFDRVYGKHPESFELRIIDEIVRDTEEELISELNYLESYYIMAFYSFNDWGIRGFNHTMGGGVGVVSEETKQKMSDTHKKRLSTSDARQKMSERLKKALSNPEARQKKSELSTKMWQSEEFKKKMSEAIKKAYSNPEVRQKLSESIKKGQSAPDVRQKMSDFQKKRFSDPEERIKHSEALKKHFEDPDARQKISEANKKRYKDQKEREKQSERLKKALSNPDILKKWLKPCHVFDIETGFYFDFASCKEASKFVGMTTNHLHNYTSKPYKKRWIYIP